MSSLPAPAPVTSSKATSACPRCGGSGVLRLADGRFRTCLDCLGQGLFPVPMDAAQSLPQGVSAPPIASIAR